MNGVNAFAVGFLFQLCHQLFGNAVYAAHCGHNPYFVSYAHFAVGSTVATEGASFVGNVECGVNGLVGIFESSCKVGLEGVFVHPFALRHVFACMADGIAVLDDVFSLRCVNDEHLVASWHVLLNGDGVSVHVDGFALLEGAQAHYHGVGGIDFDE